MSEVLKLPGRRRDHRVSWDQFIVNLKQSWHPGQMMTVVGQNGSGKSWLMRHLLEALWNDSKVILFDTKASDPLWRHRFITETEVPGDRMSRLRRNLRRQEGRGQWIRVVPPTSLARGRRVLFGWMEWAWKQGSLVSVFDETRSIVGRRPGFGLTERAHQFWQRGRARFISVVAGGQSPVHLPAAMWDEPTAGLLVGRIRDLRRLKRLEEISGDPDGLANLVRALHKFEFVYVPPDGDQPFQVIQAPAQMPGLRRRPGQAGRDPHRGWLPLLYEQNRPES